MIYWPTIPDYTMVVAFPNSYGFAAAGWEGDPFLVIRNDVGRWVIEGDWALEDVTANYFISRWDVPDPMPEHYFPPRGEYTYELWWGPDTDHRMVVSEGILIIGDYKAKKTEYEQTIYYEQYGQEIGF